MGQLDIESLDNAVVLILTYDINEEPIGHGSGFIIDQNGTVVTNYHVIDNAYTIIARLDINGRLIDFEVEKVISGDYDIDLATILLKNPNQINLPSLNISKSLPKKGEDCWTIGTPFDDDFMNSVTEGIVSNIYPNGVGRWHSHIIQVSAPFSQGSSGGALVNSFGEVIGVTCGGHDHETAARANINFAVWIGELEELPSINKPIVLDTTVYYNSQLSQSFGILLEDFRADNLNIEKILEYYVQCAELRTNMFGEYQSELPFIYEYIGLLYYELANFELAIKWILKSLDIHQKVSEESLLEVLNSERHCGLAFKLAVCYEQTKDLNNALTYYIESVKINQEHFGSLHHKTQNADRMARKLAQDLKRESDLPEWMITIREA
jgi:hypothetical protein